MLPSFYMLFLYLQTVCQFQIQFTKLIQVLAKRSRLAFEPGAGAAGGRTPRRADDGTAPHTLSRSPLAAHLGGCAPPSRLTALRWREISKMAAVRAAPARDADTATPPRRDARLEPPPELSSSSVPLVQPLRDDARDDARVALSVPPARARPRIAVADHIQAPTVHRKGRHLYYTAKNSHFVHRIGREPGDLKILLALFTEDKI